MPLSINQVSIDCISGPVSLVILSSNQKQILLFGDKHFGESDFCLDSQHCLTIFDQTFISLIDHPNVDFFIETFAGSALQSAIHQEATNGSLYVKPKPNQRPMFN